MTESTLTARAVVNRSLHWFSTGLIIPVFAVFQLDRGLSLTQLGLNVAVLSGAVAVMELPTGGLADTFGRRNTYLLSLLFQVCGALILGVSFSAGAMMVGFVLMGLARALSSGSMDAYLIDAHGELESFGPLQRFLARIGIAVPLALAIGGLAGGFIADNALAPASIGAARVDRYSLLFFAVVLVAVIQFILTLLLFPPRKKGPLADGLERGFLGMAVVFRAAFRHGISSRVVRLLLLGTAAWGVTFAGLEQYWQPYVNGITGTASPTRIFGYLTGGYFLVGSLGAAVSPLIFRIVGPCYGRVVMGTRILIGVSFLLLASTGDVVTFAAVYFLIFFLNGVNDSPEQTLLNENVPSGVRSTLLSLESVFLQAGGGVAALVWGVVADGYSISLAWQCAGGIFLASGLLYYLVDRISPESPESAAETP